MKLSQGEFIATQEIPAAIVDRNPEIHIVSWWENKISDQTDIDFIGQSLVW